MGAEQGCWQGPCCPDLPGCAPSDSDSDVDRISEWKRRDEERRRELEEKRKREQEEELRRLREQEKEEKEKRKEKAEKADEARSDSDSSLDGDVAKRGRKGRAKAPSSSDSDAELEKEVSMWAAQGAHMGAASACCSQPEGAARWGVGCLHRRPSPQPGTLVGPFPVPQALLFLLRTGAAGCQGSCPCHGLCEPWPCSPALARVFLPLVAPWSCTLLTARDSCWLCALVCLAHFSPGAQPWHSCQHSDTWAERRHLAVAGNPLSHSKQHTERRHWLLLSGCPLGLFCELFSQPQILTQFQLAH